MAELTLHAGALLAVAVGAAATWGPAPGSAAVALVAFSALLVPDRWSLPGGGPDANGRLGLLAIAGSPPSRGRCEIRPAGRLDFAVSGSGLANPTTRNRIDPRECHPPLVDQTSV